MPIQPFTNDFQEPDPSLVPTKPSPVPIPYPNVAVNAVNLSPVPKTLIHEMNCKYGNDFSSVTSFEGHSAMVPGAPDSAIAMGNQIFIPIGTSLSRNSIGRLLAQTDAGKANIVTRSIMPIE
jgi:hypothetical protein